MNFLALQRIKKVFQCFNASLLKCVSHLFQKRKIWANNRALVIFEYGSSQHMLK